MRSRNNDSTTILVEPLKDDGEEPVSSGNNASDNDNVAIKHGCSPLRFLREAMNHGFDRKLMTGIKVSLAIGEFCLLLLVLVVLLEISPADIPKRCEDDTLEICLNKMIVSGGDDILEAEDTDRTCGVNRVTCWRSAYKHMIYRTDIPSGTREVNISSLNLPSLVENTLGPRIEFCVCLMTENGKVDLPTFEFAWRGDTDFFCETLNKVNTGLGALGFFIGTVLVLFKSTLDGIAGDSNDAEKRISFSFVGWLLIFSFVWVVWNIVLLGATLPFAWGADKEIDCEIPEAQMFFYVFNIALLSCVAGIFFGLCVLVFMLGCTVPSNKFIPKWRNKRPKKKQIS